MAGEIMSAVYKPQKVFFQGILDVFFSKDAVANKILFNIM